MCHIWKSLSGLGVLGWAVGCSPVMPVVPEQPTDHPHLYATSKDAGDHHVRSLIDPRRGQFGIMVMDRYECPKRLRGVATVAGELLFPDGRRQKVTLYAGNWWPEEEGPRQYPYTARFLTSLDVLPEGVEASLRVRVPIDGRLYELTFPVRRPGTLALHSGL